MIMTEKLVKSLDCFILEANESETPSAIKSLKETKSSLSHEQEEMVAGQVSWNSRCL